MESTSEEQRVNEDSTELFQLAGQIDSTLDSRITSLLSNVRIFNAFLKFFDVEELVPVGSSQDGSKVNVPGDGGDVDILLISKAVVLDEELLEYDSRFPAYARVWGIEEHEKFFKRKRLIDDVYLPVNVLKNLEHRLYGLLRFYISIATRPGISDCGRIYNTFRESAVGFEVAALDGESALTAVQINQVPDIRIGKFKVGMKLIRNALDSLEALALKEDPHDFPDSQSQASFLNLVECVASAVIKMVHLTDGYETKKECFKRQERHEPEPFTVPIHYDIAESLQIVGETIELPKLMTADMVPAFSVRGWPRVAEEWITRARRWPKNELVQDVVHIGCQIVAKRPLYPELNGDRKNEDHSSEADEYDDCFRLSFSQCELALAKQFSEIQLLCWRTLKAYQKLFLRTESPVLTSYHWKTVLFWIREETDDEFWSERNFLNCVSKALDFMITCLLDRFLPGYFVREENLISGCREDLVVKTLNMVIEIRKAPYAYLLNFVEDPPTPDVYPVLKDKIRDFVRAENQQTLVENITGNVIHGLWSSVVTNDNECENDAFDSIARRFPDNLQNLVEIVKREYINKPDNCVSWMERVAFTGLESAIETWFSMPQNKAYSTSENLNTKSKQPINFYNNSTLGGECAKPAYVDVQVIYSREDYNYSQTEARASSCTSDSDANIYNTDTCMIKAHCANNDTTYLPECNASDKDSVCPRASLKSRLLRTGIGCLRDIFAEVVDEDDDHDDENTSCKDVLRVAGRFLGTVHKRLCEDIDDNKMK